MPRALLLTAADKAEWREYQRKNRRARLMYAVMPLAIHRALSLPCIGCWVRKTRTNDGLCAGCRKGGRP